MTLEATPAPQTAPALDAGSLTPMKGPHSITASSTIVGMGGNARSAAGAAGLVRAVRATALLPWVGLGAMTLAGVLLFWSFEAMPFMDLPAHAGLIAVRHRFASSPFEQQVYVLAPHIGPYSLFRFLGELFVVPLGPTGAVRALATLPVIATPFALLFARRRLQGDRSATFGYFGVILSFGLMTLFGFASYLLGLAVMLVALTLWLDLMTAVDERDAIASRRRELIVAAFAPLVFVAHGHAFLLFLVLAGVSAITTGDRWRRVLRLRALVPAVALAAYVAWLERGNTLPKGSVAVDGSGSLTPMFQSAFDKFTLLITPTLMTRSGIDFMVGVIVWSMLIAGIVMTVRHLRGATLGPQSSPSIDFDAIIDSRARQHSKALLACTGVIAAIFLVLPHQVGWFGFVDGRLVPIVMLLGLMAIRTQALGSALRFAFEKLGPVFAGAVLVVAFIASHRFQDEARGYKEVLAAVPTYSRLLNLPLDPNSDNFTGHPFVHYDKLAMAERPVVVSDMWFHQGSALYPTAENPAVRLPTDYASSDLHALDWPSYKMDDWDYVLVRTRPNADAPKTPTNVALVEHRGGWWLYRNATAAKFIP